MGWQDLSREKQEHKPGIALLCDPLGTIREVLYDTLSVPDAKLVGKTLTQLVDRGSLDKLLNFLVELRKNQATFDWEMNISVSGKILPLHFFGILKGEQMLVVGARACEDILSLNDDMLLMENEEIDALRLAIKDKITFIEEHVRRDADMFDENSRLNNELVSLHREVSRKNAELDALNRDLSKAQRIARLGNWEWNLKNGNIGWSDECYRLFGYQPGTVKPITYDFFISLVHQEDVEPIKNAVHESIQGRKPLSIDFRIIKPDGSIVYAHNEGEVQYDKNGEPARMFCTLQDITERKRAEKELIDAKAQVELYLDLMGHDINNMNMVAAGFLEMARNAVDSEGKLDSSNADLLDSAIASINNSSRLIGNVRKLQRGRMGEYKPEVYDIGVLVGEVCEQFRSAPDRDVRISCSAIKGVHVQANELLWDVFANLISNAIKHSIEPASVSVRMNQENKDGRRYCMVSVEDKGLGIPDVFKDVIFDRFRRGDTKAHGSGLGLYLVKTLVDSYGGKVWVEDRVPGDHAKGARFVVMLPAADN